MDGQINKWGWIMKRQMDLYMKCGWKMDWWIDTGWAKVDKPVEGYMEYGWRVDCQMDG